MPRSYRKNIIRTFRSTKSRFIAIFSIVALGVGFLAGLMSTTPDMRDSMEVYLDGANFYDLRIVSTLGLSDADVEALRGVQGVRQVQPAYSLDLLVAYGDDTLVARAQSLPPDTPDAIDRLDLLAGRWPAAPGECVVAAGTGTLRAAGPRIGDTFAASPDNEDLSESLDVTAFTVVGQVRSANYFSIEREAASVGDGSVAVLFYLQPSDFAYEAYTEIRLTADGALELASLTQPYKDAVQQVEDRIDGIKAERARARLAEVRADARAELDDGWAEYNDARAEADEEFAKAEAELDDARRELADGEQEYADGAKELEDGEKELEDAKKRLEDGKRELADGRRELASSEATLRSGEEQYAAGMQQLADGEKQLNDAEAMLNAGWAQYEAGKAQLEAAATQLEAGEAEYAASVQEMAARLNDYGLTVTEDQLAEALAELAAVPPEELPTEPLPLIERLFDALGQTGAFPDGTQALRGALQTLRAELARDPANAGIVAVLDELLAMDDAQLAGAVQDLMRVLEDLPAGTPPAEEEPAQTLPELLPAETLPADWQALRERLEQLPAGTLPDDWRAVLDQLEQLPAETPPADWQAVREQLEQLPAGTLPDDWRAVLDQLEQLPAETPAVDWQAVRERLEQLPAGTLPDNWRELVDRLEALTAGTPPETWQTVLTRLRALLGDAGLAPEQQMEELAAAIRQMIDARRTLDDGRRQYEDGMAQLEPALRTLEAGGQELREQSAVFYQNKQLLEDSRAKLDDGWRQLEDGRRALANAEREIADGEREIADGERELADGKAELADAWQKILDGRAELADGEAEYAEKKADAEKELADALAELEDGERELADLELPEWYIWDRSANTSFHSFEGNVNKVEAIARVFPVFFFLVAALVVSTTMTRMVEEERLQIGTMKAMGYARPAIMQKYIWYALIAAVLGALCGLALGFTVFPSVIWYAYEMMYYMPHLSTPWRANYATMAGGLLIGCALVTTLSACQATLRETPADLMRPRAPKAGKRILLERIGPLWRRLPFTYKVTCRNLLRYKRRFWMTVIGVAGCTALLVTGFGISDSLNGIAIKQYGDIYRYGLLTAVTDSDSTQSGQVHDYLFTDPAFSGSLAVFTELVNEEMPDGSFSEVYLMTPQDAAAFNDFVDLRERVSREKTPLTADGLILTEKLAETMGVKAGDTITFANGDGRKADFTVTGVCEHYVMNYAYIGPETYRQAFGADPEWNAVLSLLADDSQQAHAGISSALLGMDGVAAVNFTTDQRTAVLNMLNSINAVVVLIIVCAACLAFVVLYNLTNINIAERVKEIATIKVLGFYDREVSAYVNRESVALTVIGALLGLAGGIALHKFVIYTVEVDAVMFGRTIEPMSFVYALALTMLFSTLVNIVMGRKLKRISMVESMKAPE